MSNELISSVHEAFDLRHCLRPELTSEIIRLATTKHQSINVIGPRGSGKLRLLIDIQGCVIPGVKTIAVNLKSFTADYSGLIHEIQGQLQLGDEVATGLQQLFNRAGHPGTHYLLLLGYYDVLLGNKKLDPKYDKHFFDDLHAMTENPHFSLICTSVHKHNTMPVLMGGKSYGNSWLKLDVLGIPTLTRHQILDEFERRLDEYDRLWLKSNFDEKELLLKKIMLLPLPYSLLVFLAGRIANQSLEERGVSFKKKLRRWIRLFAKQNKATFNMHGHHMKLSPAAIWNAIQTYLKKC